MTCSMNHKQTVIGAVKCGIVGRGEMGEKIKSRLILEVKSILLANMFAEHISLFILIVSGTKGTSQYL